jgi:ATP-binding cassette subfamily G (WHITE) protein 1
MDSVRRVIVELKLEKVANTNVGNLSNGQKRRLTLACEIVTAPKTIFLDEPLSGLDSVSALEVATSIRALAIAGRTVVCTIHQPSSAVFALVDDLLLLVDGQVTYNGAVPTDADEPSEQIIETLMTSKSINSQVENQVKNMLPLLDPEEDMEIAVACFQPIGSLQGADTALDLFPLAPPSRAGFELRVLMSRNVLVLKRSILATRMSLLRTVGVTTIMLVIYWKAGDSYHSITSCLYFTMQYVVMQSMQVIPKFIGERKIFLHESASGLYTSTVYFHSHFYLYMLQMLLHIPIICTCVYFGVNFTNKGFGNFFFFVLIYYGLSMLGFSYATLIANTTPNVQTALNLFSSSFVFWIFFSGYAVVVHSVPKLWKWAPSVSYARWAFEALCINAFSGDTHESNGKNGDGYLTYLGFMNLANKHGSTRAKFIALGIFSAVWFFFHLLANASFSYARRQLRT